MALAGCVAVQDSGEIVSVEYETHISGEGVVESELGHGEVESLDGVALSAVDADGAAIPGTADAVSEVRIAEPPRVEQEPRMRLVAVQRASDGLGSRVVVQLSRSPEEVTPFELSAPRRCVVDARGPMAFDSGSTVVNTDDPVAPRVRIANYPDHLRLVVDVADDAAGACEAEAVDSALMVGIGSAPRGAESIALYEVEDAPGGAIEHAAYQLALRTGAPAPIAEPEIVAGSEASDAADRDDEIAEADAAVSAEAPTGEDEIVEAAVEPEPAVDAARVAKADVAAIAEEARLAGAVEPARSEPKLPEPEPMVEKAPEVEPGPAGPAGLEVVPPANTAYLEELDEVVRAPKKVYTGERISLEFKDADILNVLRIIADVARRNIVATDDVAGSVTIVLYDVPWDQALDILLKSTGLEMVEYEDVITISTSARLEAERKARLAAQKAGRELEPLQTAYMRVNYVKPQSLATILRGKDTRTGASGGQNAGGEEDKASLRSGLLSSRGRVMVDDATSTIIVRDIADGVANAQELIRRLDVQTPQVAIQGLIFEADTNMDRNLGVRWGGRYSATPENGNATGRNFPGRISVGGAGPTESGSGGGGEDGEAAASAIPLLFDFPAANVAPGAGSTLGLLLGSLDGSAQLDAQLTALEQAGKGRVVSKPKVITLNNAEAQIQSLEIIRVRLPQSGNVINTGGGGGGGAANATQAIDTGITLRVTPQISSDGYVLLQMFVKSSVPSNITTDDIPNEISRQATSQVLVRDGETVVIGGVYRQRANHAENGVPWLRTVPMLGWLFKNMSKSDSRQELLVFITPRVVWRDVNKTVLPSAADLWSTRDRSAYRLLSPGEAGES